MGRTVTAALQAELSKPITRIGYLLEFSSLPILRWCDVGDVTWNGFIFSEYDVEVRGLGGSADGASNASLKVQNLDDAAASVFVDMDMGAVTLDVWQVAPAAVALADVVQIGRFMLGDLEIGIDYLTAPLIPERSLDAFSPRRRVDPSNGFKFALPAGTKISWENEIYVVEEERVG